MGATYATVQDVIDIWPSLPADQSSRVENLLAKASALLRQETPFDIDERIALYATDPDDPKALDPLVVADVVATIVKRVLVNPDGTASESQTIGPYSKSRSFAKDGQTTAGLSVSQADVDRLRPAQDLPAAATIRLQAGPAAAGFNDGDPWSHRRGRL